MAVVEKVHDTEISFQKVRKFFKNYETCKKDRSQLERTLINNIGQFEQQNNNNDYNPLTKVSKK